MLWQDLVEYTKGRKIPLRVLVRVNCRFEFKLIGIEIITCNRLFVTELCIFQDVDI